MLKISVANRFQLRIASEFGGIFRSKNGTDIHYIGGAEILPAPFSAEEEKEILAKLGSSHDKEARSSLIEHNLRLVVYIAKKFENTGIGVEDLISIGTIGLIKAINTFNPLKNIKLATYASRCIENELLMMLRQERKCSREFSLYEPIGTDKEGNEINLLDIVEYDDKEISDHIILEDTILQLYNAIQKVLDPRELEVLSLRYGLFGNEAKTQREVAAFLQISRSYVSRIEKKALLKLRRSLDSSSA